MIIPDIPISEAAKILQICEATARDWAKAGYLKAVKRGLGRGRWWTTMAWIRACGQPATTEFKPSDEIQINSAEQAYRNVAARWGIRRPVVHN